MSARSRLDAGALREAFDGSFAAPPATDGRARAELIQIRAGASGFALPREHVLAMTKCPPLTTVPGAASTVLGIAAHRGRVLGVHSLALAMGVSPGSTRPAWVVLCGDATVALAFDALDGQSSVEVDAIATGSAELELAVGIVEAAGMARTVIDIPALLERLRSRPRGARIRED